MRRLLEHYRLPEDFVKSSTHTDPSSSEGYFTLGRGTVCFGTCSGDTLAASVEDELPDIRDRVRCDGNVVQLPFDPDQLIDNLLLERYPISAQPASIGALSSAYYALRPLLPVAIRKHAQRYYLRNWERIRFPHWPVDVTVERLLEQYLRLLMQAQGISRIPFIWFWPDGYNSSAIVTHDVETAQGRDFCSALMDIDDSFGIKSAFQIVPENRYAVSAAFLDSIRDRGFEINVHDLNHDGNLFRNKALFLQRVVAVNRYGKEFRAAGFRAGVLYRNQRWCHSLEFEYDMSVPNVAHLDPQRGGCCTVLPYFIGSLLELPSTMTQDYALFHYLRDYSLDFWKRQIELIRMKHGLISVLVHPDYILRKSERDVYLDLLRYLDHLRKSENVWIAMPGHVNTWWRMRSQLTLVPDGSGWRIQGPGSDRARLAYAHLADGAIRYEIS